MSAEIIQFSKKAKWVRPASGPSYVPAENLIAVVAAVGWFNFGMGETYAPYDSDQDEFGPARMVTEGLSED